MSASLVGSEMCIRDRLKTVRFLGQRMLPKLPCYLTVRNRKQIGNGRLRVSIMAVALCLAICHCREHNVARIMVVVI
eukprot:12053204-Alexandrium_andersonii.AAC.1